MCKKIGLCVAFILCGCTTDPLLEEEYESPSSDFPLLGTVPDRPIFPSSNDLQKEQKHLQQEHDQAMKVKTEILESTKS